MEIIKLPREESETVQGILSKDIDTLEKAKLIYKYNDMCRQRLRKGGVMGKPILSIKDIEKILIDRQLERVHNSR